MSEQLTAYLDGELPSEMHEVLFEELARSPELREEMNEHLLIRAAVQKDNALPSSRVLDNLLAAVETGGTTPLPPAGTIGGSHLIRSVSGRFSAIRSYVGGFVSLIIGLMAPAVINESVISTMTSDFSDKTTVQQNVTALTTASSGSGVTIGGNVQRTSVKSNDGGSMGVQTTPPITKSNEILAVYAPEQSLDETASVLVSENVGEVIPLTMSYSTNINTNHHTPNQQVGIPSQSLFSFLPEIPHDRIAVRMRGLAYNTSSVSSSGGQWFDNLGIGIFYNLGKGHFIGVDVNNERPQLSYNGIVNNRQLTYQQNPSYLSVGLTYRYNAEQLHVGDFHPFAELSGGLALPNMPIGRTSAGINFVPTSEVRFSLGVEYNTLQYQFLGENYSSSKWGINYGVMINLDAF